VNSSQKLDCRSVWGKFLLALRENKELSLHAICVELSDYYIEDEFFVINVGKKLDYDSLKKLSNLKKVNDTFNSLELGLKIDIRYKETNEQVDRAKVISQILGCEVVKK